MTSVATLVIALFFAYLHQVAADSNGMDMSMDGAMDLAMGNMLGYLHFTPGDNVWFQGWVPKSAGAMVGACIGLFLLGIVDRWIAACRSIMEAHWRKRMQIVLANKLDNKRPRFEANTKSAPSPLSSGNEKTGGAISIAVVEGGSIKTSHKFPTLSQRMTAPFILSHDIPRGIVHASQALLEFAFMLIVMTYQVSFILSIVFGLGVGETLFGRYNLHAHLY